MGVARPNTTGKARSKTQVSKLKGQDSELAIAISLQEAATWIGQAAFILEDIGGSQSEIDLLRKMGRNLKVIHNKHSRLKMS